MGNKKPVYLSSGGRPASRQIPDPLIQAILRESGVVSPTIAYVGAASGDNEDFFNRIAEGFREAGVYRVNHALISSEKADLEKAQEPMNTRPMIAIWF